MNDQTPGIFLSPKAAKALHFSSRIYCAVGSAASLILSLIFSSQMLQSFAGKWPLFQLLPAMWEKKLHPAVMVTLPQQHCQKCVFQYTENDAMSYFHHRDICLGVGCGHAIIPKNTQSVCMFILSCVILHYDEFLTLFCILFVSGYHVCLIFCLQHLSGHLFY